MFTQTAIQASIGSVTLMPIYGLPSLLVDNAISLRREADFAKTLPTPLSARRI
jgi:hypothetical protein